MSFEWRNLCLRRKYLAIALTSALIAGCGTGGNPSADASGSTQGDYTQTKQMVIDILHSNEGRTALQDMFKDPNLKQQLIVSETDVAKAVEKTLQSKKNQSFLSAQSKDPKFAAALSKAVQPELVDLQRQLMKDPEYQKSVLTLLKSPEFTKMQEELFQSPGYRTAVMKIMIEALQTPSFRMQFQDALKRAVAESIQASGGSGKKQGGGQKSSEAGGGGGGGGGGEEEGGS